MKDFDVSVPVVPENIAFGNSVAKSMNSPEMILSLICGVTGGNDTVPSCGERPTVVVVTAPGIVLLPDVAQGTVSCHCC